VLLIMFDSEEIESVTIIDCLVRAGASVCVASVESTHQVSQSACPQFTTVMTVRQSPIDDII
jgi:hypothetical protein